MLHDPVGKGVDGGVCFLGPREDAVDEVRAVQGRGEEDRRAVEGGVSGRGLARHVQDLECIVDDALGCCGGQGGDGSVREESLELPETEVARAVVAARLGVNSARSGPRQGRTGQGWSSSVPRR